MKLLCNRVLVDENDGVLTADFTDSAGVTVVMRIVHPLPEGIERPLVGKTYTLAEVNE